jgi:hypothetical protein
VSTARADQRAGGDCKEGKHVMGSKVITIALAVLALTASRAFADHERFNVATMRNVDPSGDRITSTSGACIPSHDRARLECYFTSFAVWKTRNEEDLKKNLDEVLQELNKESSKSIQEMKNSICDDKNMTQPDPLRVKYNAEYKTSLAAMKAFCDHPTRESAASFFRTMNDIEAKKCNCVVSDWRSTFVRQIDRWIENTGPAGPCGVIKVFTLVPHDLKKMKDPTGPVLWTLHERTVTTHAADNKSCAEGLFKVEEGAWTVSWNAPIKSTGCGEIEFMSALEGMSDPRKK